MYGHPGQMEDQASVWHVWHVWQNTRRPPMKVARVHPPPNSVAKVCTSQLLSCPSALLQLQLVWLANLDGCSTALG